MNHRSLLLSLFLLLCVTMQAADFEKQKENEIMQRYFELFNQPEKEKEFYEVNKQVKDLMLQKKDRHSYYVFRTNEITHETNMHRNTKALKMANELLREMKENGDSYFDLIYNTMGTLYEERGNYKMAQYYHQKAIDTVSPNDTVGMIGAHLGLANLETSVHPDKAIEIVDQCLPFCKKYPSHYSYAQTMKGLAFFFKNDPESFYRELDEYNIYKRENNLKDDQNDGIMKTIKAAFDGNYDEALQLIKNESLFSENMGYYDMLKQLYQMMGNKDKMISIQQKKLDAIDSLNANLIYENMNAMNAEMEVNKAQQEVAKTRLYWLTAVIILLIAVISLLFLRNLTRRGYQKRLLKKNKELGIALSRAEESDRMKTSFIEHVSHEIRTPINIITGYAQIITNPYYDLEEEERSHMLDDIKLNTMKITDIVNDLLEVAQDESKQYYAKEDTININSFCQVLVQVMEQKNSKPISLSFKTDLSDDYTFKTNKTVLEKSLTQLLDNALKFTEEGSVELYVHESPDHGVVRFIVSDTGIGIDEEQRKHIFERFYKADPFKQGFGLGLTICHKVVQLLGGSLHLDTTYKDGARFILTLPIH